MDNYSVAELVGVSVSFEIEDSGKYLTCKIIEGFQAADVSSMMILVLSGCTRMGHNRVLLDFRVMREPWPATSKLIAGMTAQEHIENYQAKQGVSLKFAILGNPPFVSTYRPTRDLLQQAGQDVETFTSIDEALDWLL